MFISGFEKEASLLLALGAGTEQGKKAIVQKAENEAKNVERALEAQKKSEGEYYLNPVVPGPVLKALHRLKRRHYASLAEHPFRTALIPGYGLIRGGKAGKDILEDAEKKYSK